MKSVILALVTMFSLTALANDGGIVGVKVDDLKIDKVDNSGDQAIRTPLDIEANESVDMTFKGESVRELMKWLPGGRAAVPDYSKHMRSIAVAAKEGYLVIHCADADLKVNENGGSTWTAKEPACTVSMNKYKYPVSDELLGDLFGDWQDLEVPLTCKMK
ncbi:MAG: hypothetical protein HC883_03330 [Bdellovibrionaceae bacterium]|nr:hypothetical protein [Pseudobdellovibrionaceae bacterium]